MPYSHVKTALVRHCTRVGTTQETGQTPYMAELVGAALLPLIDRAIARLVREALDHDATWEVANMAKASWVIVAFGDMVEGVKFTTSDEAIHTGDWIIIDHF
jgi:hypothetical protein